MRLDGYREILGFIGRRGLMSWNRMKQAGIPFEKERGLVYAESETVGTWWAQEQARRITRLAPHMEKMRKLALRQRISHGSQDA